MPPRRSKVDHRRGGGGGDSKRFSSADDVKARNAGEETAYEKARRERTERQTGEKVDEEDEEESSEEEKQEEKPKEKPKKPAAGSAAAVTEVHNPNAVKRNEEKEGVELTRKQREEMEKNAARRRYEELHKAGKTDEAKADLARLEEVKKRREEATKKKAEEEAAAKEKELEKGKKKGGMSEEVKEAMGGEAARTGARSKVKRDGDGGYPAEEAKAAGTGGGRKIINGVKEELVYSTYISDVKEDKDKAKQAMDTKGHEKGSIQACRAAEEDFM